MSAETPDNLVENVAAVDLGSNSFHLVVARVVGGNQFTVVDRLRERVTLAAGLDDQKKLMDKAQERALLCLQRFGQRLRFIPGLRVRAVGTSAMRQLVNPRDFLTKAEEALGHDIEIIAGVEEARLIYLGVSHSLADDRGRRLVVDIGGGSTEIILGERFEPVRCESLGMGCVVYSLRYFGEGKLRAEDFERAEIAARLKLQPIELRFRNADWHNCVGSSGTILTIDEVLRNHGWSDRGITLAGLKQLRRAMLSAGHLNKLTLNGLSPDRAPVFPGGVAILTALFESLGVEQMFTSTGSMREGVLYDLMGRIRHEDVRDITIRNLAERYHVDVDHAARVEHSALTLLDAVFAAWEIDEEVGRQYLGWAARLHEIGLSVSYSGYHKHSAYLVANSDMSGFSREDQAFVSALILGHRKKLTREPFTSLPPSQVELAVRLCALLRLAVRLNRARSPRSLPSWVAYARKGGLALHFPPGWIAEHPLTRADLQEEADRLLAVGLVLSVD